MRQVWLTAVFLGLATAPAYAYIDPVTGSVLIQGLIGGAAAILASIRSVREKVLGFFTRKKSEHLGADADVKN
jgi:hypothetical protein